MGRLFGLALFFGGFYFIGQNIVFSYSLFFRLLGKSQRLWNGSTRPNRPFDDSLWQLEHKKVWLRRPGIGGLPRLSQWICFPAARQPYSVYPWLRCHGPGLAPV